MSNQSTLQPNGLTFGIYYRYTIYGISYIGGRIGKIFRTGWRPLALWFGICILIALVIAQVTSPVADIPLNNTSSAGGGTGSIDESLVSNNLTVSAVQNGISGDPTSPFNRSAFAGNITGEIVGGARSFANQMDTNTIAWVFGVFVFGVIAFTGYKSRKQVLVDKFENYIDESKTKFTEGVSSLLNGELHRLRLLYSEVDDRRAIASVGGRSGQLDYAIKAGDTGEKIENSISTTTTMKIGPIEVPIGAVAGVFNKFFSGPQITGAFHRDGNLIVLTAFMSGSQSRSWRVEGKIGAGTVLKINSGVQALPVSTELRSIDLIIDKEGKIENLDVMVKELACRIFTDLTSGGTTKWRATYHFTDGLREYRNCLLSKKDQLRNLKNAERRFLEAISEDSTFDLAWYNLGVVYTELGNLGAAEHAFLKAVEMKPESWEPYYALALNRFNKMLPGRGYFGLDEHTVVDEARLRDVIHPCEQAIALNPDNYHLHILIGVCYRLLAIRKRNPHVRKEEPSESSERCFGRASEHHRIAVRNAWYALCAHQFSLADNTIGRVSDIRKVSSTALWDLARTYLSDSVCTEKCSPKGEEHTSSFGYELTPIASVFRQALFIDRTNALVFKNLGIVSYAEENYKDASRSFESATRIDPTNMKFWLLFALSSQKAGYLNKREFAAKKFLEYPSLMQEDLSPYWKNEIRHVLRGEGLGQDIYTILEFQEEPGKGKRTDAPEKQPENLKFVKRLKSTLEIVGKQETNAEMIWKQGYLSYHIAKKSKNPNDKIEYYKKALDFISHDSLETNGARDWVRGVISYELAYSSDSCENYQKSNNYFRKNHPLEIKKKKIDLVLVDSLLKEDRIYEALDIASKARHENPLGFSELNAWGRCLAHERDYKQALFAFESALLLEPYDVNTLENIGLCYWKLGDYCQKRDEKESYWNKAILYYEDAGKALKEKEYQDGRDQTRREYEKDYLYIPFSLGCCYLNIGKYGNAAFNFDLASSDPNICSKSEWDHYYCVLNSAEALLHKRDQSVSELYFEHIIKKFRSSMTPDTTSQGKETQSQIEERVLLQPMNSLLNEIEEIPYAGEIYIRALIGLAYSYAERDAGLKIASGLIEEADRITQSMKRNLGIKEKDSEKMRKNTIKNDKNLKEIFLGERIPLLEADILDRGGWIIFKQMEAGNLENARKEIQKALSLKQNEDYYFHLAHIHAALSRESPDKKDINIRLALAYCDHVLDMAPRKSLEDETTLLAKDMNEQLSKQGPQVN